MSTKKDIHEFQENICKTSCILKGKCIENKKESWFLACPHYHKWKWGYKSWTELVEESKDEKV